MPFPASSWLPRVARLTSAAAALLMAAGCAGLRAVDVDVHSFASWPAGLVAQPGSTYRFERLPSQQTAAQRDGLEASAREAFARRGLQQSQTLAQYSAQVSLHTQLVGDGYSSSPYGGSSVGISTGVFSGGGGFGGVSFGFPLGAGATGSSAYRLELVVLLRSLQTNAVVFESRAQAVTPSGEDPAVLAAMMDSALRGFPVPLAGPQRYRIDLAPTVR